MGKALVFLNLGSGIAFVAMGIKAIWDYGGSTALLVLTALAVSCAVLAYFIGNRGTIRKTRQ